MQNAVMTTEIILLVSSCTITFKIPPLSTERGAETNKEGITSTDAEELDMEVTEKGLELNEAEAEICSGFER